MTQISAPDFSAIDRAVEKVIAKHECLFRIELIGREKIDDDLHWAVKLPMLCSKAARMAVEAAKLKAIICTNTKPTEIKP